MAGKVKIAVVLGVVAALVGGALALGMIGKPTVESVDNHFDSVSNETTTIDTNLTVANPNPIGVQLGGVSVNYSVAMNDVAIARGSKDGIALSKGNSTLEFTTQMENDRIPAWWYTHIDNGETTTVGVNATVRSSTLGQSIPITQEQTIETDLISQFNSTETRPVDADQPLVSDPVLYINETRGSWDQANLTREQTPMNLDFTVYNPKSFPYTVSKIGYTISMNDVTVGAGETERGYVIAPRSTETIEARTAIDNENLDDWWVTHLQRNQVTDLYIDFYLVLEGGGQEFRIDLDSIDYEQTIETDIFGNKAAHPTGESTDARTDDSAETATTTPTESSDGTPTATPTEEGIFDSGDSSTETATETETDGGLLDSGTESPTRTEAPSETETPTATPTPTETETDDGGLL